MTNENAKRPRYLQEWDEAQVTRMLCNPFYCGVRIDPLLIIHRPQEYNRGLFMEIAVSHVVNDGAEDCMRAFIRDLKHASAWTRCLRVHTSFVIERVGIVSEQQFIQAGAQQIDAAYRLLQATSATPWDDATSQYFAVVIENLEGGNLNLS